MTMAGWRSSRAAATVPSGIMWQTAPSNGWSGWASFGGWIDMLEVWPEAPGNP